MKYLIIVCLIGCVENLNSEPAGSTETAGISDSTDPCFSTVAPCVVTLSEPSVPSEPVVVQYRMCCPVGTFKITFVEVTGREGNWGDVTRWGLCAHTYSEEFVHPNRLLASPWSIVSVYDGNGGDITSCRTPNAPPE
mgnify:CR=1